MADPQPFEAALAELESRVTRLERGDLDLEEALRLFEEGVALVRECHEKLDAAESRIVALTAGSGSPGSDGSVQETEIHKNGSGF